MKKSKTDGLSIKQDECPDADQLAAMMEGKLLGTDHAWVLNHLQNCPECRDVVADSAILMRELSGENPSLQRDGRWSSVFFPKRRLVKTGLVAISLSVAMVMLTLLLSPLDWSSEALLISLSDSNDLLTISSSINQSDAETPSLSMGFSEAYSPQKRAFNAGRLTSQLAVLDKAELPVSESLMAAWRNVFLDDDSIDMVDKAIRGFSSEKDQKRCESLLEAFEKEFQKQPTQYYFKLGVLVQTASGYALVGKIELLDQAYLKYLLKQPEFEQMPIGVRTRLSKIMALTEDKPVAGDQQIIYNLLKEVITVLS